MPSPPSPPSPPPPAPARIANTGTGVAVSLPLGSAATGAVPGMLGGMGMGMGDKTVRELFVGNTPQGTSDFVLLEFLNAAMKQVTFFTLSRRGRSFGWCFEWGTYVCCVLCWQKRRRELLPFVFFLSKVSGVVYWVVRVHRVSL